ncbi:hypothetical protein ACFQZ4_48630 [Catellatospora coxensis]
MFQQFSASASRPLRRRALLAAGAAAGLAGLVPARARAAGPRLRWTAGDHHVHTKYSGSPDAPYRVEQHVQAAAGYGLGWLVVTDHPGPEHARHGLARSADDLAALRARYPRLHLFQGIEWRVPGAEHATVFTAPGPHEAALLADFESRFDAELAGHGSGPDGHATAVAALRWLGGQVDAGDTPMALCILNHPSRSGAYSPAELRRLRDAHPMVIGMEGAPGGQANGIPAGDGESAATAAGTGGGRRGPRTPATLRRRTGPWAASTG